MSCNANSGHLRQALSSILALAANLTPQFLAAQVVQYFSWLQHKRDCQPPPHALLPTAAGLIVPVLDCAGTTIISSSA